MDKQELSKMYIEEHLTMEQIGKLVGMTRAGVQYWTKKYGIEAGRAEKFKVSCHTCGKEVDITRKRFVKSEKHFCHMGCYSEYLRSPEWRKEQDRKRIARVEQEERNRRDRI